MKKRFFPLPSPSGSWLEPASWWSQESRTSGGSQGQMQPGYMRSKEGAVLSRGTVSPSWHLRVGTHFYLELKGRWGITNVEGAGSAIASWISLCLHRVNTIWHRLPTKWAQTRGKEEGRKEGKREKGMRMNFYYAPTTWQALYQILCL